MPDSHAQSQVAAAATVAVLRFPGSNCDDDARHVLENVLGADVRMVWHRDGSLDGVDAVVIPGGFSYGDYLRSGAMAAHSPVMADVRRFAERGGPVIGICNGFQILTEAGLLPGALGRNPVLHFLCRPTHLRVENDGTPFTRGYARGQVLNVPIAHNEGSYFLEPYELERIEGDGRVAFRYVTADGEATSGANPNGSTNNIAGIVNERGNVLGMMPHPERAAERDLGSEDGLPLFRSLLEHVTNRALAAR